MKSTNYIRSISQTANMVSFERLRKIADEIDTLEAEVAYLEQFILKYGRHLDGCDHKINSVDGWCTCGFIRADNGDGRT